MHDQWPPLPILHQQRKHSGQGPGHVDDTARKVLKNAGYLSRVVRRKPYISMTKRLKWIAFARDHIHKPLEFWRTVIFSNESKLCIFGIKGRKLVWRKPCTALQKEHLVPTVKYDGDGVMMWECMASNGVESSFSFKHGNDPKHTAKIVKLWLLYNVVNQLHTPSRSPDLNPIEHLRDLLKRRIHQHNVSSKDMLKSVLKDEWEKIIAEETTILVNSMPKRLQEFLKRRSYPTSYYPF
ncbi:transposable element Tcb2 transposase [Trichonephila clavipes]|nr:transposable element Tcb2 transposase [Trichonephila clavipes]